MKGPVTLITMLIALTAGAFLFAAKPEERMAIDRSPRSLDVAVVVYDGMEILDFAGPAEVFAAAGLRVYTVSENDTPILSQGFVRIKPEFTIANAPAPDILVIPGGSASRVTGSKPFMSWIRESSDDAEIILTVCTGAFVLAEMKVLDGLEATTWHGQIENFRRAVPRTVVHENTRFVDNGKWVTTAGVSAGIDGSLHVVSKLFGEDAARSTARYMEYDKWVPTAGRIVPSDINQRYERLAQQRKAARLSEATPASVSGGVQTVEIMVTEDGYRPSTVTLKRGVPARLVFERKTTSECLDEVEAPALGLKRSRLADSGTTSFELTPEKEGSYALTCGMSMFRATVIVQ